MKRYWNNKAKIINYKLLALCFMLSVGILFCWLLYPEKASSGPYLDSAHANTTDGVKRSATGFPTDYSRGNCAHCHEQHASITGAEPNPNSPAGPDYYLLFMDLWVAPPQSNEFCFGCHIGAGSYQSSWGRTPDFACYSYRAGGDTSLTCPASVYESFQFVTNAGVSQSNCGSSVGSSHMLRNIRDPLSGVWGFSGTNTYVNPCSGCHNPHRAQRDPHTSTGRLISGKLVSSVSKPSDHADLATWQLWGDDSGERMSDYTTTYWAPMMVGSGYEPDGSSTQDGSNMVDYVGLCRDCHNSTRNIFSTRLGRNLYKITWGATGDFHGKKARNDSSMSPEWGDLLAPYKVSGIYQYTNYVLSCTDCHEPHGSPNEFLLRKTVNGTQVNTIAGNGQWYYWCRACHAVTVNNPMHTTTTYDCYQGSACHRHGDGTGSTLF